MQINSSSLLVLKIEKNICKQLFCLKTSSNSEINKY